MESKSTDPSPPPAEAPNHRRRGGNPKRNAAKAAISALSNLSAAFSTPSKRQSKDRNPSALPHHMLFQSHHSGPLTRARQSPNKLGAPAASASAPAGPKELLIDLNGAALGGSGFDPAAVDEELVDQLTIRREEEENVVNLEFEAVKSRGKDVHVVPTFAGETHFSLIVLQLKFQYFSCFRMLRFKFSASNSECTNFWLSILWEIRICICKLKNTRCMSNFIAKKDNTICILLLLFLQAPTQL